MCGSQKQQLYLELVDLHNTKKRISESKTIKGRWFNFLGYFFSIYCAYKIFMRTINIIFDRPLSGWCPCSHFDSGPSYQSYKVLLRSFFLRNIKRNRHVLCTADGNVLCEVKAINLSGKVTNNLKLDSVKNFGNS
ncbi:unnamed protein product [Oikopleura dioica]|uniref:Abscisic acid G-protein coupled receptor-like domain-containing protein n=1 Tax=Oikopleura dioica TaxID=34765 RepID=E4XJI1_OIKDI|nr:unnamed protein product [Oikopleura dioica]